MAAVSFIHRLLSAALPAGVWLAAACAWAQDDAPMAPPPPASAPPSTSAPTSSPALTSTAVSPVTVTGRRPTTVTGVTVVAQGWCPQPDPTRYPADHDPVVVDSYPAQGATIPPGAAAVRVSFDSAMSCDWDLTIDGGVDDPCAKAGAWALPTRKSFVTACTFEPKTHYVFHFRKSEGYGFSGLSGRRAQGFDLAFDTSDAKPRAPTAPSLDPRSGGGEAVRGYVTCVDQGADDPKRACQRALIDPDAPPAS